MPLGTIVHSEQLPTSPYATKKPNLARCQVRLYLLGHEEAPPAAEPHDVDQSRFGRDQMSCSSFSPSTSASVA